MKKTYISSKETGLPFSEAVEVNGFVYLSGQLPLDGEGNLAGKTIEEKTHLTMQNVQRILAVAGLDFSDVVKMELFLPDLSHRAEVSSVYESYLSHPFPVRAMIGVASLPLDADIEITAIAVRKNPS